MAMPNCTYPGCHSAGIYIRADGHQSCRDHRSIPWPGYGDEAAARVRRAYDTVNQQYADEAKPPAIRTESALGAIGGLKSASRARMAQNATRARSLRASRQRALKRAEDRKRIRYYEAQLGSAFGKIIFITVVVAVFIVFAAVMGYGASMAP